MKALAALTIVVAGAVAGFAIYAFGWREDGKRQSDTASVAARSRHIFTMRQGDIVRVPVTATRCEASHEGGIPNLFCTRTQRGRYQVVFWKDEVQVYDLARHGEPMVATFVVPAEMKRRGHPQRPNASAVVPFTVSRAPTPRLRVARYDTSGAIPQVSGGSTDLRRVNAALREAVLGDQRAYAPRARGYAKIAPRGCRGVYRVAVDRGLLSASGVVVSALLPAMKLYPCGNEGQGWVSMTVRVPSGRRVTLGQLFRDAEGEGLRKLGVAWFRVVARRHRWHLECVVLHLSGYEPTLQNYRYFALTPRGLALAFWQEPACSRVEAIVPYQTLRPYLSRLGKQLIAGVRRPR